VVDELLLTPSRSPRGFESRVVERHDYNGGIQPSGLFWVVELPGDAFQVNHGGQRATLEASDVCVIDSFQFLGPNSVPATVSFKGRWQATGPWERRGRARRCRRPTRRRSWAASHLPGRRGRFPVAAGVRLPVQPGDSSDDALRSWAPNATASSCRNRPLGDTLVPYL
jgi:hypothetical protein